MVKQMVNQNAKAQDERQFKHFNNFCCLFVPCKHLFLKYLNDTKTQNSLCNIEVDYYAYSRLVSEIETNTIKQVVRFSPNKFVTYALRGLILQLCKFARALHRTAL